MDAYEAANGSAVALAVVACIGLPRKQVRAAIGLYLFVAFNWWFYLASTQPIHPLKAVWDLGIYLRYDDAWALNDALTASFAALAGWSTRAWWFAAVYLLSLAQIGFHVAFWTFQAVPESVYYQSLNVLFWGILSAAIFAGGKGVKDRVVRGCAALGASYRVRAKERGLRSASRLAWPE